MRLPTTQHEVLVISPEEIKIAKQIGEGYYSTVVRGTWGPSCTQVAVKQYKQHVDLEFAKVEIDRLAQVAHKNVVRLHGIVYTNNNKIPSPVMEWVSFGRLTTFLFRCREKGLRGEKLIRMAHDIAAGMEHLHSKNLVHGDLATRNCLIDSSLEVKIADLGHYDCRVDGKGVHRKAPRDVTKKDDEEIVMKLAWRAPECLPIAFVGKNGQPQFCSKKKQRTAEGDVWAFGCVLYELWTLGRGPFGRMWREEKDRVYRAIINGHKPTEYGRVVMRSQVRVLMDNCWEKEPGQRPKFSVLEKRLAAQLC